MDNWILRGPKVLVKEEQQVLVTPREGVKVKVSHGLITNYDAALYAGTVKTDYPRTIGRAAIGIVTEVGEDCYGIEKGDRVFLKPIRPCGKCEACKSGNSKDCADIKIAGRHFDGFFRDFAVCDQNDVSVLPPSVDDVCALSIEWVALAERIFDKMNLKIGDKVAIFGGGFTGLVLAQVALYHKYLPIVIDNNSGNLERAKRCGIYYTMLADDELLNNIVEATSGQLCDGAVYTSNSRLNPAMPTRVVARGKSIVLGGFNASRFALDMNELLERNVTCLGIGDGFGYTRVAINMLVNGAVNMDMYSKEIVTEPNVAQLLENRLEGHALMSKMTILKFII